MPKSVFPYVGGKARYADNIISRLPSHRCYIEPFGGSGTVLYNKPPSNTEVYNDVNGDLVQFFKTLREETDELVEWLECVPFSREVHEEWSEQYYDGYRPQDPVERAGRFYALRYMQFGGTIDSKSGFRARNEQSPAKTFANARDGLREIANRFREVIIEHKDWSKILTDYDDEHVVFYCDPPYIGRNHYGADEFDHDSFVSALDSIDGEWAVSYDELPDGLKGRGHVTTIDGKHRFASGKRSDDAEKAELLVTSYDPEQTPRFESANQSALTSYQ